VPRIGNPIALLIAAILVSGAPAFAEPEKVGVAAEVNPDVTGQPPNEPLSELLIGHNIIRDEKITTEDAGQAQLLFTDQSTLTVARNSEVVIDEFVFDPKKQAGNLTAALTTGLFRYVGGKISKQKDVTFYTPTGTVSVRGGIALIRVQGSTLQAIFVFGQRMTVTVNGQTQTATQPNTIIFTTDGRPSSPAPASAEMLALFNRELQSSSNQTLAIGNDFATEAPDLAANFIPTPTPRPNPAPTPAPPPALAAPPSAIAPAPSPVAAAPAQPPAPTFSPTPTATLAATATPTPPPTPPPSSTPTPPAASMPAPPPASAPPPPPASTPPPSRASQPKPPRHHHHRVDRDRDHDDDIGDRHHHHRDMAERKLGDRGTRQDRDQGDGHRLPGHNRGDRGHPADDSHIGPEPAARAELERRNQSDASRDRHGRASGEDPDHHGANHPEGHGGFDRYVISDDHDRDDHTGERQGFDRHRVAGRHAVFHNEHDGDPSDRFGHRRARDLLALNRFHNAVKNSWGRPMPYWADGGRPDGHSHAGQHHTSPHH